MTVGGNVAGDENSHSDLPDGPKLSEDVVHFFGGDFVGQIADIEHPVHLRRKTDLHNTPDNTLNTANDIQAPCANLLTLTNIVIFHKF